MPTTRNNASVNAAPVAASVEPVETTTVEAPAAENPGNPANEAPTSEFVTINGSKFKRTNVKRIHTKIKYATFVDRKSEDENASNACILNLTDKVWGIGYDAETQSATGFSDRRGSAIVFMSEIRKGLQTNSILKTLAVPHGEEIAVVDARPNVVCQLLADATVDILQIHVPAGEPFLNPFAENGNETSFDEDKVITFIEGIKLNPCAEHFLSVKEIKDEFFTKLPPRVYAKLNAKAFNNMTEDDMQDFTEVLAY